jgi:hypothetical protein
LSEWNSAGNGETAVSRPSGVLSGELLHKGHESWAASASCKALPGVFSHQKIHKEKQDINSRL